MDSKDIARSEEFIAYDLELLKNSGKWKKYCRVVANAMSVVPFLV